MDSSVITYECSCLYDGLKSFSIGFKEQDFDESEYALALAKACHINNTLEV